MQKLLETLGTCDLVERAPVIGSLGCVQAFANGREIEMVGSCAAGRGAGRMRTDQRTRCYWTVRLWDNALSLLSLVISNSIGACSIDASSHGRLRFSVF